jgi:opacity protein-like surface antigen
LKLKIFAAVILLCAATAAQQANAKLNLPAASAPQASHSSTDWGAGRFTLAIHFGATNTYTFGNSAVNCTDGLDLSCVPGTELSHDDGTGILPTAFTRTPGFFQTSKLQGGSGASIGASASFNINPRWELEVDYTHLAAPASWTNVSAVSQDISDFCNDGLFTSCFDFGTFDRRHAFLQKNADGSPRGEQSQLLFNIKYNINTGHRWQPYIGAGLGFTHYGNLPAVDAFVQIDRSCTVDNCTFDFQKFSDSETAFSLDGKVGAKYYLTRHWGLFAEFQNVVSFTNFDHTFQSVNNDDVCTSQAFLCSNFTATGTLLPPTGKTHQDDIWSHAQVNGGLFWKW